MPKRAADDGETSASKKKAKQDTDASDSTPDGQLRKDGGGNYYLDLGNMKRVTVSMFKERAQLDIREYYMDKTSGDVKPGKKGITLNSTQWTSLCSAIPALTEKLEAVQGEATEGSSKTKKVVAEKAMEKAAKDKKSEKPVKKKKKKEEPEDGASD